MRSNSFAEVMKKDTEHYHNIAWPSTPPIRTVLRASNVLLRIDSNAFSFALEPVASFEKQVTKFAEL